MDIAKIIRHGKLGLGEVDNGMGTYRINHHTLPGSL